MHGEHVEQFELCREQFLIGNPGTVKVLSSSQHAGRAAKLEHDQRCTAHGMQCC